ncbi:hypothetical protein C8Q80DRAFT_379633 [Daedaleopsis nitida]|nr:hypothetical protein C8Q80DRAFT_379633 [Daedaleopsis nitida]
MNYVLCRTSLPSSLPCVLHARSPTSQTVKTVLNISILPHSFTTNMLLPYRQILALAFFRLAISVRAAPTAAPTAAPQNGDTVRQVEKAAGDNKDHVGAGVNIPPTVKSYVPRAPQGVPIHIMQGNAEGATVVPIQNYKNDAARLPGLDALAGNANGYTSQ